MLCAPWSAHSPQVTPQVGQGLSACGHATLHEGWESRGYSYPYRSEAASQQAVKARPGQPSPGTRASAQSLSASPTCTWGESQGCCKDRHFPFSVLYNLLITAWQWFLQVLPEGTELNQCCCCCKVTAHLCPARRPAQRSCDTFASPALWQSHSPEQCGKRKWQWEKV